MPATLQLPSAFIAAGLILTLDAAGTGFTARPSSRLTPALRASLAANKPAIMATLRRQAWDYDERAEVNAITRETRAGARAVACVADDAGRCAMATVLLALREALRCGDLDEIRAVPAFLAEAEDWWGRQVFPEPTWTGHV